MMAEMAIAAAVTLIVIAGQLFRMTSLAAMQSSSLVRGWIVKVIGIIFGALAVRRSYLIRRRGQRAE
jgi:hypothetical protein